MRVCILTTCPHCLHHCAPLTTCVVLPRPHRLSVVRACAATQRRPEMRGSHVPPLSAFVSGAYDPRADHTNTIVFVGGITGTLTDQDLADAFSQFGRVTYARVAMGKGCGFVHFESRQEAEAAVAMGDQMVVAGQRVRVSWGKSKSIVKVRGGSRSLSGAARAFSRPRRIEAMSRLTLSMSSLG